MVTTSIDGTGSPRNSDEQAAEFVRSQLRRSDGATCLASEFASLCKDKDQSAVCLLCKADREGDMEFLCRSCDQKQERRQSAYDRAKNRRDLADRFRRAGVAFEFVKGERGFHSYQPQNASQETALRLAQHWADEDDRTHSLFFFGDPGLGKTHLAQSAVTRLIERGKAARFISARRLQIEIRSALKEFEDGERLREFMEITNLAIDDVGVPKELTQFQAETLLAIIDYRVLHRKRTFISANFGAKDLAKRLSSGNGEIDGFLIVDRIRELAKPHELIGTSHRGRAVA